MKKLLMVVALLCLAAPVSAATYNYGWEDCGTVFCVYPLTQMICTNDMQPPGHVYSGLRSLRCEDAAPTGTPNAAWVWIRGLVDGDIVTASFWAWDITPSGEPSCRIWSHYYDGSTDPCTSNGSASGPAGYSGVTEWTQMTWTVTMTGGHTGLVFEIRTYTNPGAVVWIDDGQVIVPDRPGITVTWPAPGPSGVEETTWGGVKALYR